VIRVLVADDQRVVREGLTMLVGLIDGIEVIGAVADGWRRSSRRRQPGRTSC
jgi:DNA-binding NarL/FixJ family response regulator